MEQTVQHAVVPQNCFPGIAANQVTGPQRDDDELVEQFFAFGGVKRQVIRQRVAEQQHENGYRGGDAHGAEKHIAVKRVAGQFKIILQIPVVNDGLNCRRRTRSCSKKESRTGSAGIRSPIRWAEWRRQLCRPASTWLVVTRFADTNRVVGLKFKFMLAGKRAGIGDAGANC